MVPIPNMTLFLHYEAYKCINVVSKFFANKNTTNAIFTPMALYRYKAIIIRRKRYMSRKSCHEITPKCEKQKFISKILSGETKA